MSEVQNDDHIFHRTLKQQWQQISHGEGVYLFDTEGKRYLDACAGVHVVSIGHGVKEIADVMGEQASQVCFTYSRFLTQAQIDLAQKIDDMAPEGLSKVFFVSGGSEATESAMKMARKYHIETGNPKKYKVISRWQSWARQYNRCIVNVRTHLLAGRLCSLSARFSAYSSALLLPLSLWTGIS